MNKLLVGIQARSNSTRLPGKIYLQVGGKSILKWVYDAAKDAKRSLEADKIYKEVVIMVLGPQKDEKLSDYCKEYLIPFMAPECPEDDLVARYSLANTTIGADLIMRVTSDCLFLNPGLICEMAKAGLSVDYCSNTKERTFPEGFDLQICKRIAYEWISENQKENREHPFFDLEKDYHFEDRFAKAGYTMMSLLDLNNPSTIKTSIDTQDDLDRAKRTHSTYMKRLK
jgi:spore coat polysaccharide biosynthesis protein SpsF (cytidylyltransferase family)